MKMRLLVGLKLLVPRNNDNKKLDFSSQSPPNPAEHFSFIPMICRSLMNNAARFNLKHMDRVYVRTNPDFESQQAVQVSGSCFRFYTILKSNESLRSS